MPDVALLFVLFYSGHVVCEQKHLLIIPLVVLVCNDHFCDGELAGTLVHAQAHSPSLP